MAIVSDDERKHIDWHLEQISHYQCQLGIDSTKSERAKIYSNQLIHELSIKSINKDFYEKIKPY